MNWIDNVVRPKIRSFLNRREVEDNLWVKCPETGEMVFHRDLEANQWVVPNSGYHMKIKPTDRLGHFFDDGQYTTIALPAVAADPLKFRDTKRYTDRLKEARNTTGRDDAIVVATGKLYGQPRAVPACRRVFSRSCRCRAPRLPCSACAKRVCPISLC